MSDCSANETTLSHPRPMPFHSSNDVFAETSSPGCNATQHSPNFPNGRCHSSSDEIHSGQIPAEPYHKKPDNQPRIGPGERSSIYKKLESVKSWSMNTFKCTKQVIEEKLGATTPTCDEQLDLRIETLRQMQKQYRILLDDVRRFTCNFAKTLQTQREFAGHLAHAGQQQPELTGDFACNAELQRTATINGEKLLCVLEAFCDGLDTLLNRTFEDTMLTIRSMNSARIEFDAYRKELNSLQNAPKKTNQNETINQRRLEEALGRFRISEENFLDMKSAVDAKLRLLHENRVRVMQHNLLLLNSATSAYFSGDSEKLDRTLKHFNIKITSPQTVTNRWSKKQLNQTSASHHSPQLSDEPNSPDRHNNSSAISNGSS